MPEFKLLFSRQAIEARVSQLAEAISAHYAECREPVVAVCVLKGAFVFFADLLRKLRLEPELDFVRLASYGNQTCPSERLLFSKDMEIDVKGKHVLIVEDIVDTGSTVHYLSNVISARGPLSIRICSLIHKSERREAEVDLDFYGFRLEKGFVVGYGLDCAERYRQLEAIYELVFSEDETA